MNLLSVKSEITFWVTLVTGLIALATFIFLLIDRKTHNKKTKYKVKASKQPVNHDKFYIFCEVYFKNFCPRPVSIFEAKLYYSKRENPLLRDVGYAPLPTEIDTNQEMNFNIYFPVYKEIPLDQLRIEIADNIRRTPCKIRVKLNK